MIETIKQFENKDAIIEVANKERSACKLIAATEEAGETRLQLESIFPVRELNTDPSNPWQISLSVTAFGKSFSFTAEGEIVHQDGVLRFTEKDRGLEISLDFRPETVHEKMTTYIDGLIPKM